jgi:hypothetical protein
MHPGLLYSMHRFLYLILLLLCVLAQPKPGNQPSIEIILPYDGSIFCPTESLDVHVKASGILLPKDGYVEILLNDEVLDTFVLISDIPSTLSVLSNNHETRNAHLRWNKNDMSYVLHSQPHTSSGLFASFFRWRQTCDVFSYLRDLL